MKKILICLSIVFSLLALSACGGGGTKPSVTPTVAPSVPESIAPSVEESVIPSVEESVIPSEEPSVVPTVEATVEPTVAPTQELQSLEGIVSISPATNITYNGEPKYQTVNGMPNGVTAEYIYTNASGEEVEPIVPGDYTVTAVVSGEGYVTCTVSATFKIREGLLKNVVTIEQKDFVYDGEPHELVFGGVPENATIQYEYVADNIVSDPATGKVYCIYAGSYRVSFIISAPYYRDYKGTELLKIAKAETVITVEQNQELACIGACPSLVASINHNEAEFNTTVPQYRPGSYETYLTVEKTDNYNGASVLVKYSIVAPEINEEVWEGEGRTNPIEAYSTLHEDQIIREGFEIPTTLSNTPMDFTMSRLFGNSMLLQAQKPVQIWGSVSTDSNLVAVQIYKGMELSSQWYLPVDKDGYFQGYIGQQEYTKACTLRIITQEGKYIEYNNVAFGELFLGGGQSNMGWQMSQCFNKDGSLLYQNIINASKNDDIHIFKHPAYASDKADDAIGGEWTTATPGSVTSMSAAAYFFVREMYDLYQVPVGIITACMGGIGMNQWMPEEQVQEMIKAGYMPSDASITDPTKKHSAYYNGTVYPLHRMTVRGVLWYQGEGDHVNYAERFCAMITGWRKDFDNSEMKFVTIGMPRMTSGAEQYAKCRDEHKRACTMIDGLTYSSSVDTGLPLSEKFPGDNLNSDGIHPYQKEPVGKRSADAFAKAFFAAQGTLTSPTVKEITIQNGNVIIECDNVGSGLILKGAAGFQVLSKGQWINVKPEIVGGKYIVLRGEVCENPASWGTPTAVRYGWVNTSPYIVGDLDDFGKCVCVYNTAKGAQAYPLDSFNITL